MNVEEASAVLMDLVAIRERHGESFETARRNVFSDERFAVYVAAYEGDTMTDAERAGAELDRRIEARLAEADTDPRQAVREVMTDPKTQRWVDQWIKDKDAETDEQSQVINTILKRAKNLRAGGGGDVLDYISQVLKDDPELARQYRGLD